MPEASDQTTYQIIYHLLMFGAASVLYVILATLLSLFYGLMCVVVCYSLCSILRLRHQVSNDKHEYPAGARCDQRLESQEIDEISLNSISTVVTDTE